MERVARMLNVHEHYLRWTRSREADDPADASHPTDAVDSDAAILRLVHVVQSILLWENSRNSVSAVVVFNVFFWLVIQQTNITNMFFLNKCYFIYVILNF